MLWHSGLTKNALNEWIVTTNPSDEVGWQTWNNIIDCAELNWKYIVTSKERPLSVHNAKFMWEIYKGNSGPLKIPRLES